MFMVMQNMCFILPGLIKIRTSVNFLCDTGLRTLQHVSPQFQEKCPLSGAKTQVKYVNPGTFLLCRYRYILLCFYYVAAVQNSIIRGLSLKTNALSCCKYAQTQP